MYTIRTPGAPRPLGSYAQGASAARYVFVSAQLPQDPATGELVGGSIGTQCVRCVESLRAVLEESGLGLDEVCRLVVYLTSMDDLEVVDEVLGERFEQPWPSRDVVGVAALPLGAAIQISCVACR